MGDIERLREAYKEWPLFTTFIDNIEMSISTQVHALSELRIRDDMLTPEERANITYLILCTVSGVAAGLQNTG